MPCRTDTIRHYECLRKLSDPILCGASSEFCTLPHWFYWRGHQFLQWNIFTINIPMSYSGLYVLHSSLQFCTYTLVQRNRNKYVEETMLVLHVCREFFWGHKKGHLSYLCSAWFKSVTAILYFHGNMRRPSTLGHDAIGVQAHIVLWFYGKNSCLKYSLLFVVCFESWPSFGWVTWIMHQNICHSAQKLVPT